MFIDEKSVASNKFSDNNTEKGDILKTLVYVDAMSQP